MLEKACISPQHLTALRNEYERLHRNEVGWVVCASIGLALQGVPASAHAIDLETDAVGACEIERLFTERSTRCAAFYSTPRLHKFPG